MAFDPAAIPFCQFVFREGAEQPGGAPPFLVGLLCEAGPTGP